MRLFCNQMTWSVFRNVLDGKGKSCPTRYNKNFVNNWNFQINVNYNKNIQLLTEQHCWFILTARILLYLFWFCFNVLDCRLNSMIINYALYVYNIFIIIYRPNNPFFVYSTSQLTKMYSRWLPLKATKIIIYFKMILSCPKNRLLKSLLITIYIFVSYFCSNILNLSLFVMQIYFDLSYSILNTHN